MAENEMGFRCPSCRRPFATCHAEPCEGRLAHLARNAELERQFELERRQCQKCGKPLTEEAIADRKTMCDGCYDYDSETCEYCGCDVCQCEINTCDCCGSNPCQCGLQIGGW